MYSVTTTKLPAPLGHSYSLLTLPGRDGGYRYRLYRGAGQAKKVIQAGTQPTEASAWDALLQALRIELSCEVM